MADAKISALTALTGANVQVASDLLAIVDTSTAETKKILIEELFKSLNLTPQILQLVMDSASGRGIKVDLASPTYPWADIIGNVETHGVGANDPTAAVYRGVIRGFQFDVGDEVYNEFHIPHDYVPGTDLYVHAHWSHNNATTNAGGVTWRFDATYAKGHDQASFIAPINTSVTQAQNGQYRHMIAETPLSAAGGAGGLLVTGDIETDGLILTRTQLSAETLNGGAGRFPFLHFVDIHYQSTGIGTKNKAPNFYT